MGCGPADLRRPPALRLRRSHQFAEVRACGRIAHGPLFSMSVTAAPEGAPELGGESQIGLITSRRVGGAVVRVLVRRRLRELHRLHRPHIRSGLWIVLIGKTAAATAPWTSLCTEWLRLGRKLSIFTAA